MTTTSSPLKKIKSFFSFGEFPHEELQNSSQRTSPLEQSSPIERIPSESEVLNAIDKTFKIMEREDVFTESPNGSSVLRKNPWIILTKSELDDLTNTLDILLTAKKTQLLEKSFQEKCNGYQKNLQDRLSSAKKLLQENQFYFPIILVMQSELEQTLPLKERTAAVAKLSDQKLVETYEEKIPEMVNEFRKQIQRPLDSSIKYLSFLAAAKPNPLHEVHYQLLQECHEALKNNQTLPLAFSVQNPETLQAIDLVKKTWQENNPQSPKSIPATNSNDRALQNAGVNRFAMATAYNTLRKENAKSPHLKKEFRQSMGPDFEEKSIIEMLKDIQHLIPVDQQRALAAYTQRTKR